jgi:rhomboid protease GluP
MSMAGKNSKRFMPTYVIIGLNIAVYAYTSLLSGNLAVMNSDVIAQYGQYNLTVFRGGYWQLFTSMFVHLNIAHIAGNMFFLLIFGLRAEELFSIEEYLAIYLLSGLCGNFLTLLFGPYMISAGASGAIFGLFGATVIYVRRAIGQSIVGALIFAFFLLLISSGAEVNYLAHFGGLAFGLAIGYALGVRHRLKTTAQHSYSYSIKT